MLGLGLGFGFGSGTETRQTTQFYGRMFYLPSLMMLMQNSRMEWSFSANCTLHFILLFFPLRLHPTFLPPSPPSCFSSLFTSILLFFSLRLHPAFLPPSLPSYFSSPFASILLFFPLHFHPAFLPSINASHSGLIVT